MDQLLLQVVIYLGAGVIAVPIAHRLGLGSVLGYLLAGIAIAPILPLVGSNPEDVQHFAEFGVVMMLFLVGLELQPSLLWSMRTRMFGLGGLQVLITASVLAALAYALGDFHWKTAVAIGLVLSLSSTAIVLQTLSEKGWLRSDGGQASLSVLLFQDIAVIPMLTIIPLLAVAGADIGFADGGHGSDPTLISELPGWARILATLAAVAFVVILGRYVCRPLFRIVARTGVSELFVASSLLLVVLTALVMSLVGLSPALGAFVAGVVLAESEYRHELVSDIQPFKGLLLGVFFITVGARIDFAFLLDQPAMIFTLTIALIVIKMVILAGLAVAFGLKDRARWMFILGLAQSGEFAFVLLTFAVGAHVFSEDVVQTLSLVVTATMLATPLLFLVFEKILAPRVGRESKDETPHDTQMHSAPVIVAGMGRFGQIIQRLLVMTGHRPVVLDHSADHIEGLRKFGIEVYYGNVLRPDLLEAAGIGEAKLLVVATDERDKAVELVRYVRRRYPLVHIIARAASREHVYQLRAAGAHSTVREMFGSSLEAATQALTVLGYSRDAAERKAEAFTQHDEESLERLMEVWDAETDVFDNNAYLEVARMRVIELEDILAEDAGDTEDEPETDADVAAKP